MRESTSRKYASVLRPLSFAVPITHTFVQHVALREFSRTKLDLIR